MEMRRLLLVTHRPIEQAGGPAARWRAFASYLPEYGWTVDVLSATERVGASEFDPRSSRAVAVRAKTMAQVARMSRPLFGLAGVRPDSLPLSMLWIPRGALLLRRRIAQRQPDVVLASGPPIAGLIAARAGICAHVPLVMELRDLWAGSPAFDEGGRVLSKVEGWLLSRAQRIVACTPEAVSDLRARHPAFAERVTEISNGFDPRIRSIVGATAEDDAEHDNKPHRPITLLHSGTLSPARPIAPLLRVLGDPRVAGSFRLVLHGYLSPTSRAEVERACREIRVPVEVLAPSSWEDAVTRIAGADAGLITQSRAAGDETAIASKIYEYLALEKPVLCMTDGGASESLLRRIEADDLCARLDTPETILTALLRLRDDRTLRRPAAGQFEAYNRRALAGRMAALLEQVAGG